MVTYQQEGAVTAAVGDYCGLFGLGGSEGSVTLTSNFTENWSRAQAQAKAGRGWD